MNREELIEELQRIFGQENVLTAEAELLAYEYDSTVFHATPGVVVFPTSAEQLSDMVRLARQAGVPYVARGAGTNLSGGSIPPEGGIVVAFTKMDRILEVDIPNRRAVVEPGVVNLDLKRAVEPYGLTYAPDPASQKVSTMGGNVAENAGGPHCLKYGVTANHVLGLEVVLPDGRIVQFGGRMEDVPGYDLVGLFVGAEGTLGLITQIIVRLVPLPEAAVTLLAIFDTLHSAAQTVSDIIARGIVPAALEMMDHHAIGVVEANVGVGLPTDAAGALIIELEGLADGLERQAAVIQDICLQNGARQVQVALSEEERERLWTGRRAAFGAMARLAPSGYLADGVVPRTRLPEVLEKVEEISRKYGLEIGNVFHAGDGNIHPHILFDEREPGVLERVFAASAEILEACVAAGGTITGEHGIGLEKRQEMSLLFSPQELALMARIKRAFDPQGLCNPEKVFPQIVSS
ncbi:MAG: FAD-binding oxidoreductase [Anaerolineae bacterium]